MRSPTTAAARMLMALGTYAALAGCVPQTAAPGDAAYRSPEQGDVARKIPKGNDSPEEAHFGFQ